MITRDAIALGGLLVALVVGGAIAAWRQRRAAPSPSAPSSSSSASAATVPSSSSSASWSMASSVLLGDTARAWMDILGQQAAADGLPAPYVTSGQRTGRQQAEAMLAKVARGEDLLALYSDDDAIRVLLALPRDAGAWAAQIDAWTAQGRYLSSHLRADALDLRTCDLRDGQREQLAELARELGAEAIDEGDHLHIEGIAAALATV